MSNFKPFKILLTLCVMSAGFFIANHADAKSRNHHDARPCSNETRKCSSLNVSDLRGGWYIDTEAVGYSNDADWAPDTRLISFQLDDRGHATDAYLSIARYNDAVENIALEETFDGVISVEPKPGLRNGFRFVVFSAALNFSMQLDFLIRDDLDKTHPGHQSGGLGSNCKVAKASLNRWQMAVEK